MKNKTLLMVFSILFSLNSVCGQEISKSELKAQKKIEKEKEIQSLIDIREFEFVADRANPQGYRSIDLTTNNNFLRFKKDTIHSAMPFFGRGFAGVGYGGDSGGLDFKGAIKDYSIKKGKKSYTIKASARENTNSYDLILEVFFEGTAYLSINSSKRSTISYNGKIHKIPVK